MSLISIIITTYNRPDALDACLKSLGAQSDQNFEILIADDGSDALTRNTIHRHNTDRSLERAVKHVYQDNHGFRAGTIRNKAVACCTGDYIIFIDGDCLAFPDFIAMHRKLAEPRYFVPGNRILISQEYTRKILEENIRLYGKSLSFFLGLFLTRKINHFASLFRLPLGFLRRTRKTTWKKAKTCNLALWRRDFTAVNGFDESFEGWGYEDSDLIIRLIHSGIYRKIGRHAVPVLHLWHPENDRTRQAINLQKFMDRLKSKQLPFAVNGFNQHINDSNRD